MKETLRMGEKAKSSLSYAMEGFLDKSQEKIDKSFKVEKLVNEKDMWSIRIDSNFRIEFIALDINEDLRLIENIKIMEVSKHYG